MKAAVLVLAPAIAFVAISPANAECKWGRFHFVFGTDSSAMADADSGQECKLFVHTGHGSTFQNLSIVQQAKHGKVAWNGSTMESALLYTSKAGYTGPDDFVFSVTGTGTIGKGTSNISVSVNVK